MVDISVTISYKTASILNSEHILLYTKTIVSDISLQDSPENSPDLDPLSTTVTVV